MSVSRPQESVQLGRLLKRLRNLAELSGLELAALLRISQSRVSRVEAGGLGVDSEILEQWLVKLAAPPAEAAEARRLAAVIGLAKGRGGGGSRAPLPAEALEFRREVGERIAARRAAIGLRQADLAAQLDVERATVAAYELGRLAPPPERLYALARHLKVTADHLLGLDRSAPAAPVAPAAALVEAWAAGAAAAHRALTETVVLAQPPAPPQRDL